MGLHKLVLASCVFASTFFLGACSSDDDSSSANNKSGDTVAPLFSDNTVARPVGATSIVLTWDAAFDETTPEAALRYEIDVNGAKAATVTGKTQYTLTELAMNSSQSIRVTAIDAAGNRTTGAPKTQMTGAMAVFGFDIQPVLVKNCSSNGCHNSGTQAVDMDFSTVASAYTALMGPDSDGTRLGAAMQLYEIFYATPTLDMSNPGRPMMSDPGVTTYTLTDLAINRYYQVIVVAVDTEGNRSLNSPLGGGLTFD